MAAFYYLESCLCLICNIIINLSSESWTKFIKFSDYDII